MCSVKSVGGLVKPEPGDLTVQTVKDAPASLAVQPAKDQEKKVPGLLSASVVAVAVLELPE